MLPNNLRRVAYPPTSSPQQRRDPTIAITAVLAGKLNDRLRECIFVFPPDRTITLCAAWLIRQPACPALRHPMLLLCMGRGFPSSNGVPGKLCLLGQAMGLEVSRGEVLQHKVIQA